MLKHCGFRFFSPLSARLNQSYVRKKQIDEICTGYKDTPLDQIRMYSRMFAHIVKQGFLGIKKDYSVYQELRNKPESEYTSRDWNQMIRLHHDFFRLGPLFIIQVMPFSGPLFVLYMYTYPGSIPSWFIIDKYHQDHEKKIRIVQQQAIEYFIKKGVKSDEINFDSMSLEEARKLAECLYGYHRDGTYGYKKIFKKDIPYVISEDFSKYLIKRKLKYKFRADLENKHILSNKTFDEKIKWKFQQVVYQGKVLKNYEDTLTEEELAARKDLEQAQQKMELEGNHNTKDNK